jgi:cell division protein FtsW
LNTYHAYKTQENFRPQTLLLFSTILLLALSSLMVFSTTAVSSSETLGRSTAFLGRHLFQMLAGFAFCAFLIRIPPEFYRKWAGLFLGLCVLCLIAVLIPGVGQSAGGATRWLGLGPFRFQPGEVSKLALVIYMAAYVGRHSERMQCFVPGVLVPLCIFAFVAALLLRQPDFGTTSILAIVVFIQILLAARLVHLAGVGLFGVLALGTLIVISPYRFRRFEAFLDPLGDSGNSGYQLVQSLIAVGSGGLWGEGLGAGNQKLYYLPAAHTDFIFAVIAEELGFVGAAGVVLLFVLFALSGYSLAKRLSGDPFLCALALGLTSLIVVPALLNFCVVLGLLPTKGLVLPFVAYGGTAMIVNLSILGILLRIARSSPK